MSQCFMVRPLFVILVSHQGLPLKFMGIGDHHLGSRHVYWSQEATPPFIKCKLLWVSAEMFSVRRHLLAGLQCGE